MATKLLVLLASLVLLQSVVSARDFSIAGYDPADLESDDKLSELYDSWCAKHGKFYNALGEKATRFEIFKDNLKFIHEENLKQNDYTLGLTSFADLSHDEFKSKYVGSKMNKPQRLKDRKSSFKYANVDLESLPESIDWREKGAVSYVKDQGSCGSCWAFSAIAAVEGINQIVTKDLIALSEQELVDCDTRENEGCNGGLMDYAFEFIINNGGIDTEKDYPYAERDGTCDQNRKNARVVKIDGYEDVPENDEQALEKAVAHQPVSVAIEAGGRSFQFYISGVYTGSCGTDVDHGVTNVGYGTEDGKDYWIVKNSWGASWGEKGFIKMQRGIGLANGLCGINIEPSYPTKDGANPPRPPPTPPSPVSPPETCDEYYTCAASTTCCCVFPWRNLCFSWGCCPMTSATCCEDNYHCCPSDYPICNLDANTCLRDSKDTIGTNMLKRSPAELNWMVFKKGFGRRSSSSSSTSPSVATQ